MRVKLAQAAAADLRAISRYIRAENPSAALRVEQEIRDAFAMLRAYPYAGRHLEGKNLHRIATARYPYLIYYQIDESAQLVSILAIRHAARAQWTR